MSTLLGAIEAGGNARGPRRIAVPREHDYAAERRWGEIQ